MDRANLPRLLASVVAPEALAEHAPMLLALARSLVRDDAEAQDVVQVTFEIALRRLVTLRDAASLRPWLCAILVREAYRAARRLRRLVRLNGRATETWAGPTAAPGDPAGRTGPAIRAALLTLPPRIRAAVVLHHLVGLSVAETATVAGVSENTVKTQLRIGLARLREELRDG